MTSTAIELQHLREQLDAANTRMTDGDWSLWRRLLSDRDDVAILGAYGACLTGQKALSARFGRTANAYAGGGGNSTHEDGISWAGDDLACSVTVERHESRLEGAPSQLSSSIARRMFFVGESGEWKVVLRHADPLAGFVGPQVSHDLAGASTLEPSPSVAIPAMDNARIVRGWAQAAFNEHDLDAAATFLTPDWVGHWAGQGTARGPEGFKQLAGVYLQDSRISRFRSRTPWPTATA